MISLRQIGKYKQLKVESGYIEMTDVVTVKKWIKLSK